jgi:4-amino-4-deoxy-L-arabinose transferase-like glycosyltransferase
VKNACRRVKAIILVVLVVSLLLKLLLMWHILSFPGYRYTDNLADSRMIAEASNSIWGVINPFLFRDELRVPGYHLLVAITRVFFGREGYIVPIQLLQLIMTTVMAYVTYLIARSVYNEKTALIAGTLTAFYPVFTAYSFMLLTDLFFVFFTTIVFHRIALQPKLKSMRNTLLTGFLSGVWMMIRYLPLLFIPILGLWFAWLQRHDPRKAVAHFTAFILMSSVLAVPWSIAMSYRHGAMVLLTPTGIPNVIRHFTDTPEYRVDGWVVDFMVLGPEQDTIRLKCLTMPTVNKPSGVTCYVHEYMKLVLEEPLWVLSKVNKNIRYFFAPDYQPIRTLRDNFKVNDKDFWRRIYIIMSATYIAIFLLFLVGLVGLSKKISGISPVEGIIILFILYTMVVHLTTLSSARYRLPITPFMIIYAAKAVEKPRETFKQIFKPKWKNLVLLAAILYFSAFFSKQIIFVTELKRLRNLDTPMSEMGLNMLVERAINRGDSEVCDLSGTYGEYKRCLDKIALKTGKNKTIGDCDTLIGKEKVDCRIGVAAELKAVKLCDTIEGRNRTDCIIAVAVEQETGAGTCDRLWGDDKAECITAVAVKQKVIGHCYRLQGEERTDCITAVAIDRMAPAECDRRLQGEERTDCIKAMAKAKKAFRICNYLQGQDKEDCINAVKTA